MIELKKCSRCGNEKPIDEFPLRMSVKKGVVPKAWCFDCETTTVKAPPTPEQVRERNTLVRYGITIDEVTAMGEEQQWSCAVCDMDIRDKFYIDHDHMTGVNRQLLCFHCNVGLGHFFDSVSLLEKAIAYLRVHGV